MENWKEIDCFPGYKGVVEVSDMGRVRVRGRRFAMKTKSGLVTFQTKPDQLLAGEVTQVGYRIITLTCDKKRFRGSVHRLVAKAFVDGYRPGLCVDHINGDKLDNRASNLQWITLSANTAKGWKDGLINTRGESHPMSKLTASVVAEIKTRLKSEPASGMGADYGVADCTLRQIRSGRNWR